MAISTFFKQVPLVAGLAGVLSVSSLAIVNPAQAASLDLSTWSRYGDVIINPNNSAKITNAFSDGSDDPGNNFNASGSNPLLIDDLETALDLPSGGLGQDATEGSAISTLLSNIKVGDVFSFDFGFSAFDSLDRGFVTIDDLGTAGLEGLFELRRKSPSPFSFSFLNAGNYRIGIGVIDVNDTVASSVLNVSNAQVTAVPTPALLPAIIGLGVSVLRKNRRKLAED